MIPWILMIGILMLFGLWLFRPFDMAWLHMPSSSSSSDTDIGSATDARDSGGTGKRATRGASLPADNRVLDRKRRDGLPPLDADVANAAADEDANTVAAMVSEGVVTYEQAKRRQEAAHKQTPAP
jgi:hypothetical protein